MSDTRASTGAVPRRRLRLLLPLALALAAVVLLFEAALRLTLLTDTWDLPRARFAWLYSDRWNDSFYYQLDQRLTGIPGALPAEQAHPTLGWIDTAFDATSFEHRDELDLGGRRPVLLFGDSFVRCVTDSTNCFEGWMQRSAWDATHRAFNYGVRGYGLDQIAMLARETLPRWIERDPVVVIGIYLEDDLDRVALDYRGWPKPRLKLDADNRLIEADPVPSQEQYELEHPLWQRSLAWGWLLHGSGILPSGLVRRLSGAQELEREKQVLCAAILTRLEQDLVNAGAESFYVLFPGPEGADSLEPRDWRESFLMEWLDARDLPYISVGRELLRAAIEEMRAPSEYFGLDEPLAGHLTPEGNRIAFQAIERGLRGEFERLGWPPAPHADELKPLPPETRVRRGSGWSANFPDPADSERILFAPLPEQPARVGCTLSRPARRFVALARLLPKPGAQDAGAVRLEVLVDGKRVFEKHFALADAVEAIEVGLHTNERIEIIASAPATPSSAGTLLLSRPRFQ